MLQAMFNGVSAIEANQTAIDVIGNNIANVNTTAYKSGSVSFEDQLSQTMQGASAEQFRRRHQPHPGRPGRPCRHHRREHAAGRPAKYVQPDRYGHPGQRLLHAGQRLRHDLHPRRLFSVDNSGNLVNANGSYVLGWSADATGKVDNTQQITPASHLTIPVGGLQATARPPTSPTAAT